MHASRHRVSYTSESHEAAKEEILSYFLLLHFFRFN